MSQVLSHVIESIGPASQANAEAVHVRMAPANAPVLERLNREANAALAVPGRDPQICGCELEQVEERRLDVGHSSEFTDGLDVPSQIDRERAAERRSERRTANEG